MTEDPPKGLDPMAHVIAQRLAVRPEHFVTQSNERQLFQALSGDDLRRFVRGHGWRVVRRIGGRQIDFHNEA
ncbi:MAG TPA: hypothetical protein VGI60_11545 [Chthoniobacterales bacterium]